MGRRLRIAYLSNAGDTVFWAGSPKNSQLRVFSMAEGSNQYSSRDIDIDSWPNGTITLNAPDGVDNFSFGWPGNAITGATRRTNNEVWFAWNTSSNANFKNAHVEVVEINTSNFTKITQWQIWNDSYAFVDPYLATNANSEVGIALAWGAANTNYMSHAVGILGDFIVWYPELSTASPVASQIRLGDYFTVSRNPGNPLLYRCERLCSAEAAGPGHWLVFRSVLHPVRAGFRREGRLVGHPLILRPAGYPNSRRLHLFERRLKGGVESWFFVVRGRRRMDSLRAFLHGTFFRKENRKDVQTARSKCARATEQVKSPHPPETFAVTVCEAGPGAAKVFLPGEECRVVIRPDVLDVFNDENAFRSARQASEGREHRIWEDVARDPGIGVDARRVSANSLAKK